MQDYDRLASKLFNDAMEGLLIIHRTARDHRISAFLRADDDRLIVGPFDAVSEKMAPRFREQLERLEFEPQDKVNAWIFDTSVFRRGRKTDG